MGYKQSKESPLYGRICRTFSRLKTASSPERRQITSVQVCVICWNAAANSSVTRYHLDTTTQGAS